MSFTLNIEPEWNIIKKIKEFIHTEPRLQSQSADFREATLLTAIELVENGLKYSESEPARPVSFVFDVQNGEVVIEVHNSSDNTEHLQTLQSTLEKINSGDPFQLYVARLEQIRDYPDGHSRMGLVRIAYEGEYRLDAKISPQGAIAIRARRPLETAAA